MNNILYQESIVEIKHLFLIMKRTLLAFFLSTGSVFATVTHSQTMKVTVVGENISTGQVINEIEKQTNYLFVYNVKDVNMKRHVRLNAQNKSVAEVLHKVFDGTNVYYAMEGKNIMLMSRAKDGQSVEQSRKISGVVKDVSGEPIIGANVMIKGESAGTITDLDGRFSLDVPSNAILTFSYIGFITQEVPVSNRKELNVVLKEDTKTLDEVVVIGYGTAKKSDLTGSLTQVSSESFSSQNVTRVDEALQGRASGVQISNTVGAPGGDVRIRIRGANSVLGDNNPLFVIDGFVGADYSLLNPNDIKSIEVLKDASSTAIYGSRGANGVILITTKNGAKDGKVKVNYSGNVSLSTLIKKYDLLSAGDFAKIVNEHDAAMGVTNKSFTDAQIDNYYKNGGFDYLDAVFRNSVSYQHQLSVSGGTEKTQYRISGNYLNQEGIVRNTGYDRYTVRVNIANKVNDNLSFRFNASGASAEGRNNQARTGAGNPIVQALSWAPTTNPYDDNGGYLISDPIGSIKTNPLSMIYDSENLRSRTFIDVMGGVRYQIIPGLFADFQAGANLIFSQDKSWNGEYASNHQPNASKTSSQARTIQSTTQLSYEKTLGTIHRINAVVALETQKYNWETLNGTASNLKFSSLKYDNLAQATSVSAGSDYSMWALLSYLGRVNYTLMDKYLLSLSVRRDGSSKFAASNRFSTFPAAAIAWNLGNEKFIQNLNLFSKLKLRLSWGLTGSQAIEPYATLSAYNTNIYYAFTTGGRTNGIQMGNPGNLGLKWETTEQKDLGVEFGLFNGRLNVEFDYFRKNTRDLLLNQSVAYYQGGGSMTANVGNIQNEGIELSISGRIINTKNWSWQSDLNFSSVRNKVTNLGKETQIFSNTNISGWNGQAEFIYKVGEPLGTFWGLNYLGPWRKGEEAEAAKFGCKPGDARYEDLNHDYAIDGSDYKIIGSGMPKYTIGWNNSINYKNLSINAFFQGVLGVQKLNYTRCMNLVGARDARQATLSEIKERYIPGVQEDAWIPAWSPTSKWEPQSTLFLEDASYVRLKNLSVAYSFKVKKLADIKVSVNATNLFTFTGYKGIDPEASNVGGDKSDIRQGIDYGAYPNAKTFTLGLDVTF